MKCNIKTMDDKKYQVNERLVIGRNGTQYYTFISQWTIDNAIKNGDAIIENGLPMAIKKPWESERGRQVKY